MNSEKTTCSALQGLIIDAHTHVGVNDGLYAGNEIYDMGGHPYCQSVESLYYRQLSAGVDVSVIFPFGSHPRSSFPYEIDNRLLLRELYQYQPEHIERFLPFICLDPGEKVKEQLEFAAALIDEWHLYGIKFNSADRGTPVRLLAESPGETIMEFASQHDLPLIFHASISGHAASSDILDLAARWPQLRFCLAHALIFSRELLARAATMPNVWVDTAALKIQMELAASLIKAGSIEAAQLLALDWTKPAEGIRALLTNYPEMMIWGSDSPAYQYHTLRKNSEGEFVEFSFKGTYEDEVGALNSLDDAARLRIANHNTLDWLFRGRTPKEKDCVLRQAL